LHLRNPFSISKKGDADECLRIKKNKEIWQNNW
jgi:hypothetical protein